MYEHTLTSEKPNWTWPEGHPLSFNSGKSVSGESVFVANSAAHGKWGREKARHVGPYYIGQKFLYAVVLFALVAISCYGLWWFASNFGPDYKTVKSDEMVYVPPSTSDLEHCDLLGYSKLHCHEYYGSNEYAKVQEPFVSWITAFKQIGRGIVAMGSLWVLKMTLLPLLVQLSTLYADLRTRFACTKGTVRHFKDYKHQVRQFENSLTNQAMAMLGSAKVNPDAAKATIDQLIKLYRSSLERRDRRDASAKSDAVTSTYLIGIQELRDKHRDASIVGRSAELDQQIQKVSDTQAAALVPFLLNDLEKINLEIDDLISSTNHLT